MSARRGPGHAAGWRRPPNSPMSAVLKAIPLTALLAMALSFLMEPTLRAKATVARKPYPATVPARDTVREPHDSLRHEVEPTKDLYVGRSAVSKAGLDRCHGERVNPSKFKCIDCPVEQGYRVDAFAFMHEASREFAAQKQINKSDLKNEEWVPENAVVASNSGTRTQPGCRGTFVNGIFDLAGNVSEWEWDAYGACSSAKATDPMCPAQSGRRVIPGGSDAVRVLTTCAPAFRRGKTPDTTSQFVGFRLVCTAGQESCGGGRI